MVEQVHGMWQQHLHHAKVIILSQDITKPPEFLDACTIDYIEAKGIDIITEGLLNGDDLKKDYTCKAGIFQADTNGLEDNKE